MGRRQYRLSQFPHRSEIRDWHDQVAATIAHDRQSRVEIPSTGEHFSIVRSGTHVKDEKGTAIARASFSGVYDLVNQEPPLQWKPLSFWHGVFGWSHPDGNVVIRYVPAGLGKYLVTVEHPVLSELRLIALGAYLLQVTGTDFVATWAAVAAAISAT